MEYDFTYHLKKLQVVSSMFFFIQNVWVSNLKKEKFLQITLEMLYHIYLYILQDCYYSSNFQLYYTLSIYLDCYTSPSLYTADYTMPPNSELQSAPQHNLGKKIYISYAVIVINKKDVYMIIRMAIFIKSDRHTNTDKYRVAAHEILQNIILIIMSLKTE